MDDLEQERIELLRRIAESTERQERMIAARPDYMGNFLRSVNKNLSQLGCLIAGFLILGLIVSVFHLNEKSSTTKVATYRPAVPTNIMVHDMVELIGSPGQTIVRFHLAPQSGQASIPTAVPVKAEVMSINQDQPLPIEARIADGPNRDMLVDVEAWVVRPLSR